jgi:hypothetical protein
MLEESFAAGNPELAYSVEEFKANILFYRA